ncbi:hypothetical protein IV203_031257 [Nitzschia inconspicua]|uniref:Uncharacterized protein n=1 Tax=Nitzschia inconspicua TaxID=303405 RepID=A0A9K3LV19_9STRA|nr:hypothetical protein IV203_031257 [Nitzschia inconspicua]
MKELEVKAEETDTRAQLLLAKLGAETKQGDTTKIWEVIGLMREDMSANDDKLKQLMDYAEKGPAELEHCAKSLAELQNHYQDSLAKIVEKFKTLTRSSNPDEKAKKEVSDLARRLLILENKERALPDLMSMDLEGTNRESNESKLMPEVLRLAQVVEHLNKVSRERGAQESDELLDKMKREREAQARDEVFYKELGVITHKIADLEQSVRTSRGNLWLPARGRNLDCERDDPVVWNVLGLGKRPRGNDGKVQII